jgi:hypothetical protein
LIEQTHEVFQTQAKDTFAARCHSHFAGAFPEATAPCKAEMEGQNREGKEHAQALWHQSYEWLPGQIRFS